jgi:inosine-uridine nucleoside N-ribohydrolase
MNVRLQIACLLAMATLVLSSGAAMQSAPSVDELSPKPQKPEEQSHPGTRRDEPGKKAEGTKVPVILDTDIGDDIDDTWALAMLLRSPQLDLKLVTTTYGKSEYRAKIVAKMLTAAKRTDVPVGLGAGGRNGTGGQERWVKDYDLTKYAGKVHEDGVKALIDAIEASPVPVRIISIGPSDTVAAALQKQPGIAKKAIFVGMQGSVRKGYGGGRACPEYNVERNIPAAQKAMLAPWQQTIITPLDTCGVVDLGGKRFRALIDSDDPLVKALLDNYRIWAKNDNVKSSSILFDTVAIYLAYPGPKELCEMEDLTITVDHKGMTAIDPKGVKMQVAISWKNLDGFRDLLVDTLLGKTGKEPGLPKLKVSDNKRFLVTEDGKPFFWLGDTAWELFHRLNRAEADRYLEKRAKQGFTVIQAVAIAELDGHKVPNAYGHLPLKDFDPARPAIKGGPGNDYWDHVDYVVDRANSLGLYIGFLPTWGRYWHDQTRDAKPLFTKENAESYGAWLGKRYQDKGLVWILGGDRGIDSDEQREIIRAMARGLRKGDGGAHLMTFHPPGGAGSSKWFHDDAWLDFNMRQNGHGTEYTDRYAHTRTDFDRKAIKPVLDGEPLYEGHPISFNAKALSHSIAADVRRPLYWDLFSGAFGHTYGHHSVWQMWQPGREPINNPLMSWVEALDEPGALQMLYGRRLIESRPFLTRVPDDSVIVTDRVPTSVPGAGRYRFVATRDSAGTFVMVYAPVGRAFKVRMDKISGQTVKAWWYNPRDGKAIEIGAFPNTGDREFVSPDRGELLDWILVLDDAARGGPPPGQPMKN